MKKRSIIQLALILLVCVLLVSIALTQDKDQDKEKIRVFYAGSLIVPFEEIEREFEKLHPDVDLQMEGHGSIQVIRHVTEIHEGVDVIAVADSSLIPDMMYPDYAESYIEFATNEMVIAYTDDSRYADEITEENWYEILKRPDVKFGFSNPMLDSCGYRTLMVAQLAEIYYENQTIFEDMIGCNFNPPILVNEKNGTYIIVVPAIFEPDTKKVIVRGGSVQLLSLLEYGEIDYAFLYKSVAEQHGLRSVDLPSEIDLGSPEYEDTYEKVVVQLGFQRFSSADIDRIGKSILYGITAPSNAPNKDIATEFVEFVMSEEGQSILHEMNQPTLDYT